MLRRIIIDNYALIDHLEMDIDPRLNIITGETGAGKSILLGALGLLLGNKNDGAAIKDNTKSCVIEATFSIVNLGLEELFAKNDWEWDEETVIRRVITPAGKSRAFVGDIPVQLADLKELGSRLIDIHSQHQNRILSDEDFRLYAIDLLADNAPLRGEYSKIYSSLLEARRELSAIQESLQRAKIEQEWLTFQVEELDAAQLKEGEDVEAETELSILENADRISEALLHFTQRAEDENFGLLTALKSSQNEFAAIAAAYPPAVEYAERLSALLVELKDINSSVSFETERVESDPAKLQRLSDRLGTIYSLCQKHRAKDLSELIEKQENYRSQLLSIVDGDENIARLEAKIAKDTQAATQAAVLLSESRKAVCQPFDAKIEATLRKLGMADVIFRSSLSVTDSFTPSGCDKVEFLFSANRGVAPQRIERIASGGEISRVMLSLKALLAERTKLPTIIFDEIDTGVSGRIADAMGEIIASLSHSMQVIDITHLPQVASKGESHFVVYKSEGRTNITKLTAEQRVEQIATMLSGNEITEAAEQQARILLNKE